MKLRSKYTTSLFRMDRQSIQHTLNLRIASVMNYIFISFDITLIVLNRLEVMFQTVIPTYFIGIQIKEFIGRDHR